jgi:hypothetical protein
MRIILDGNGLSFNKGTSNSGKMFKKGTLLVLAKITSADEAFSEM